MNASLYIKCIIRFLGWLEAGTLFTEFDFVFVWMVNSTSWTLEFLQLKVCPQQALIASLFPSPNFHSLFLILLYLTIYKACLYKPSFLHHSTLVDINSMYWMILQYFSYSLPYVRPTQHQQQYCAITACTTHLKHFVTVLTASHRPHYIDWHRYGERTRTPYFAPVWPQ